MDDNVIDFAEERRSRKAAPTPPTYEDLEGDLRQKINRALVGLDLDPADFLDFELGEVIDALVGAAHDLGDYLKIAGLQVV